MIKPSNIRKRNFSAVLSVPAVAVAGVRKEREQPNQSIKQENEKKNTLETQTEGKEEGEREIKGERTRGAFTRLATTPSAVTDPKRPRLVVPKRGQDSTSGSFGVRGSTNSINVL